MQIRILSALPACVAISFAHVGLADTSVQEYTLEIARQPITATLSEFSRRTGLAVSFVVKNDDRKDLLVGPLKGRYTVESALNELLANSGLMFTRVNAVTIAVTARDGERAGRMSRTKNDGRLRLQHLADRQDVEETTDEIGVQRVAADPSTENSSPAAAERTSERGSGGAIEEVIVTAQKRSERLQDVPIAISVMGGRELDRFTGEGVNEAVASVPGIQVTEDFWSGAQVSVRGVAAADGVLAGSSPVAYYIDSVPFGFVRHAIGPDTSAYDLQRVEVLRGPQGTLYGASALNGVVRILTNEANLDEVEFKGRTSLSTTKGGTETYRGDLAVNLPIVEGKIAARAVLGYAELGGWIDRVDKADVNDARLANMRLNINARPTDRLSIGLTAWRSRTDRGSPTLADEHDEFPGTAGDTPTSVDYDILGLRIGYELAGFSISSATSYIDFTNHAVFDYSPFGLPTLFTTGESEVLSQEVLLSSTHGGAWRWSAGAFYRDAEDNWFQTHPIFFNPPTDYGDTSESFAVFGELTRVFLDGKLELTGGLRYFEDDVTTQSVRGALAGYRESATFDNVSPRVVLTWHPADRVTAYASYAEGFRSGSIQGVNTFQAQQLGAQINLLPAKEDKLSTYELGVKGSLLDSRVDYEAAAYYTDWQDVQQQIFILIPGVNVGAIYAVVNGESASGAGFDFAVTARPLDGLELGVNFSWNDLTMDADMFSGGALLLEKGDRLKRSAEYTVGASAGYVFPLGVKGLEGRFSASANYGSKLYSPRDLTTAGAASQVSAGDSTLNSRASLSIDSPEHWTVDLFVDNITNYRGTFSESAAFPYYSYRARPRTMGLQFEYRY